MGPFTTRLVRFFLPLVILGVCHAAWAQSPTYGLGKTPSAEEIRAWDIAISPTGKELPPGSGSAKEGAQLFTQKCAACHGATERAGGSYVDKATSCFGDPCALPVTLYECGKRNGAPLAIRDGHMGLHQSRHAFQKRAR